MFASENTRPRLINQSAIHKKAIENVDGAAASFQGHRSVKNLDIAQGEGAAIATLNRDRISEVLEAHIS